jgi:hypothetical protein
VIDVPYGWDSVWMVSVGGGSALYDWSVVFRIYIQGCFSYGCLVFLLLGHGVQSQGVCHIVTFEHVCMAKGTRVGFGLGRSLGATEACRFCYLSVLRLEPPSGS